MLIILLSAVAELIKIYAYKHKPKRYVFAWLVIYEIKNFERPKLNTQLQKIQEN